MSITLPPPPPPPFSLTHSLPYLSFSLLSLPPFVPRPHFCRKKWLRNQITAIKRYTGRKEHIVSAMTFGQCDKKCLAFCFADLNNSNFRTDMSKTNKQVDQYWSEVCSNYWIFWQFSNQASLVHVVEWQSANQKVRGLIPKTAKTFSFNLNGELTKMWTRTRTTTTQVIPGLWPMAADKNKV